MLLVADRTQRNLFMPGVALQPVGQQPLFHQATVKLQLQLADADGCQLRRQQAQHVVALMNAVHLFGHRVWFAYQLVKSLQRGILRRHRLCFAAAAQLLRQRQQFRLLRQEVAILQHQLIVAVLQ